MTRPPINEMNRADRRAARAYARAHQNDRPAKLTPIPREQWSSEMRFAHLVPPTHVWISKRFLVQMFDEEPHQGIEVKRISVNRTALQNDGHWLADLVWDELQLVKREIGFGDWYAIEIYPRDRDIVNVANLRHLWLLSQPLPIGWFT